jgi:hypothetical protein
MAVGQKCATSFSRADKADRQEAFGFTNPILVSDDLEIRAGHGRVAAAQLIGMKQAPIVRLADRKQRPMSWRTTAGAQRWLGSGGPRH